MHSPHARICYILCCLLVRDRTFKHLDWVGIRWIRSQLYPKRDICKALPNIVDQAIYFLIGFSSRPRWNGKLWWILSLWTSDCSQEAANSRSHVAQLEGGISFTEAPLLKILPICLIEHQRNVPYYITYLNALRRHISWIFTVKRKGMFLPIPVHWLLYTLLEIRQPNVSSIREEHQQNNNTK